MGALWTGNPNTIILHGEVGRYQERLAGEAGIYPGHICEQNSAGAALKHNGAGRRGELMVAIEDAFQGNTIDTVYTSGQPVRLYNLQPGDKFYGWVAASASAITAGAECTLDADGCVKVSNGTTDAALFIAEAAIDNSGGGSLARIKARVI